MDHDEAKLFHEGVELFNEGEYFDAHEVWEDIWHMASGPRKLFYQGLIQVSVTLEHVRRGNPRGVRSVYESALAKFVGLPDVYMGVRIPKLLGELRAMIKPVLDLPASRFDPSLGHGQELRVDWSLAPRLTLESDPFAGGGVV